ncbi:MAG TPA: glycosyltransferase family 87 protein [Bacteroidia bacterium]|jgi:hypothetical protein|nr:glycosyltransferase family 87 protein [Bacteroidia bacterium]
MTDSFKKYVLIGVTSICLAIYVFIESLGNGDLFIYLSASNDLFNGINIFEKKYIDGYHYFYSVLFAIVLKPLTYLPLQIANLVWLSLNLFLVVRIFALIKNLLPLHDFTKKELLILRIGGFLFSLRFIHENLHHLQITILILFLSLQGMQLVFSNKPRPFWGALLIAAGINIKLLPIVLIPYLFYRGFFKAGIYVVLICVGLLLLPAVIIGWEQNQLLLSTWAELINPLNSNHVLDTEERSFHGLSTLLSTLLVQNSGDVYALNIKRNIADVSFEQLNIILNTIRVLLVLFTLYFLRSKPFQSNVGLKHRFWELSYILLLIPLIFPHQQHYAFLFICPAFIFCLYYFIQNRRSFSKQKYYLLAGTGILVFLLCDLKLILGTYNDYYEHFKILTYGALLLLILLSVCVPKDKAVTSTT